MSDAGNIDIGSKLGSPKPTGPNDKKVANSTEPTVASSSKGKKVKKENQSVYKTRTESQEGFTKQKKDLPKIEEEQKPYKFSNKDPVLESKLASGKIVKVSSNKEKKSPPEPSLRTKLSPKGVAINPRKVKPHLPGRLKSFFDDRIKMIDKLTSAIDMETSDVSELTLLNKYAKKLLGDNKEFLSNSSIAQMLDLDIGIAKLTGKELKETLEARIPELDEDQDLQSFFKEIIVQLNQPQHKLSAVLQLFMPLPLPFLFVDLDDEFEEDEKELYEDDNENFFSSDEEESEEKNDDEHDYSSEASLSITTLYFNKIHLVIKYNKKLNKLKLGIKGDPVATELAVPIETNLEDDLEEDVGNIDYLLRLWNEQVLRVTETRILKVSSKGPLEPIILKTCNSILKTISESDIDLSEDDTIRPDYKLV